MFNREKFIAESLDSIQKQSHDNLDIIVCDDGSTDKSIDIVKKAMSTDNRIRLLINDKNMGVGFTRNVLLDACETELAVWHDSDDLANKDRIKILESNVTSKRLIFSKWTWLKYRGNELGWVQIKQTTDKAFASLMFPVDKTIRFNAEIKIGGEDWDWIQRMQKVYSSIEINDVLYHVRFHNDRIGTWKRKFRKKMSKELLNKLSYKEMIEYYKKNC